MATDAQAIPINPSRLDWQSGDVHKSYSADKIAEGESLRAPFEWSGSLWVCVSITGKGLTVTGEHELQAYRLLPVEMFKGQPTTYAAKTAIDGGDFARNDPKGFYDGILVKNAGKTFVMSGPPAVFVAEPLRPDALHGEPVEQLSLFSP